MTKKEIARLVYNNTQLNLADSQEAVQATFESIIKLLVKFDRVELRGFGVFQIQKRAARKARNPRTGEEVWVDEHETVVFKPSKLMKTEIQSKRARAAKKVKKAAPVKKVATKKAAAKAAPVAAPKKPGRPAAKLAAKPVAKTPGRVGRPPKSAVVAKPAASKKVSKPVVAKKATKVAPTAARVKTTKKRGR